MIRVCAFGLPPNPDFHGYQLESLDPAPYLRGAYTRGHHLASLAEVAGRSVSVEHGFRKQHLLRAGDIDRLYRDRNPGYMRYIDAFVAKFADADLLLFYTYCPIHPEVLAGRLSRPIRVLGFGDDPFSTYVRGIPYLWAFDGAFYVSPSYLEGTLMPEALTRWGARAHTWYPLVPPLLAGGGDAAPAYRWADADAARRAQECGDAFFTGRDVDVVYVGNYNRQKAGRLAVLKRRLGARFRVHGRWQYAGWRGPLEALIGGPWYGGRVRALSAGARQVLYQRTKIGINLHVSQTPRETGNMRMYEVPAHGMLQICDRAALDAQEQIFTGGQEAIYYSSWAEAMDQVQYYLEHAEERIRIARAGFERAQRDYGGERGLKRLLDWSLGLQAMRRRSAPAEMRSSSG